MYKLLLFDADGTILDYKAAERFALKSAFDTLECGLDFETVLHIYCEINSKIWKDFEAGLITTRELRWRRFERLFQTLGLQADPHRFAEMYLEFFGKAGFILPAAHEVLTYLHAKYDLALITNGLKDVQYSRLEQAGIRNFFSTIIISDEVGIQKPDPGIFEILFKKSGHQDKTSSLIIGDSLSSDIAGGIGYGIDTCWLNPEQEANTLNLKPTYEITRLEELLTLL